MHYVAQSSRGWGWLIHFQFFTNSDLSKNVCIVFAVLCTINIYNWCQNMLTFVAVYRPPHYMCTIIAAKTASPTIIECVLRIRGSWSRRLGSSCMCAPGCCVSGSTSAFHWYFQAICNRQALGRLWVRYRPTCPFKSPYQLNLQSPIPHPMWIHINVTYSLLRSPVIKVIRLQKGLLFDHPFLSCINHVNTVET